MGSLLFTGIKPDMAATMKVEEAGKELGISRNAAYQAARAGEIPTLRIARRLLVPKAAFQRMLEHAGQPKTSTDTTDKDRRGC
jgi:excisionase family DNA binding protein